MIAIQLIKEIVKKEVPNYYLLSDRKKDRVVRDILSDNLELIVQKIKLPRPPSKFQIILERLRDRRRSKNALNRRKPINYYLWSLLYAVKSNMQKSVASNFLSAFGFSDDSTTTTLQDISMANTSIIPQYDQTLDTDKDYSKIIPYFQIEEKLEQKVMADDTFGQFVSCLDEVCLKEAKINPNLEFELKERKDPEIPEWNKLILDVKFFDDDFGKKMQKFKELRLLINESLASIEKDINTSELIKLRRRFYIKLVS